MTRTRVWSWWGLVALLGAAACSPAIPGTPSPHESALEIADSHRALIDGLLQGDSLSDFERSVLEDHWVTDEEYAQTREQVQACMDELGYVVVFGEADMSVYPQRGSAAIKSDPTETIAAQEKALAGCEDGVLPHIESIYRGIRENPYGWTWFEAIQACAERLGFDEARGLTEEEMFARVEEDDTFLWYCRTNPWQLALEGELPYDPLPPPGAEPYDP